MRALAEWLPIRSSAAASGPARWKQWFWTGAFALLAVVAGIAFPSVWNRPTLHLEATSATQPEPGLKGYSNLPTRPEPVDSGAVLLRLVGGTAFVLLLCGSTLWLGSRWLRRSTIQPRGTGQLEVVQALPLGPRCVVYLVKAGKHQLLAGVDSSGLKSLVALPVPFEETLATLETEPEPQVAPDSPVIVPFEKPLP